MAPIGSALRAVSSEVWRDAIPDSGVSRWEFEDDSDTTTAIDSWGSHDGTIDGCTYTTDAAIGNMALQSDGVDNRVTIADDAVFDIQSGEALSVAIWIKTSDSSTQAIAINKGYSSGGVNNVWDIIGNGSGDYRFSYQDGNNGATVSTGNVADGTWHHLVGVYEQGVGITGYVDGSEVGSDSANIGGWNSDRPVIIGGGDSNVNNWYEGLFDDPRIYQKALSESEVSDLYNTGRI